MLLAAALIAAAAPDLPPPAQARARATIRILSATPVHFAEIEARQPSALRTSLVRGADGTPQPIRLLEFE